ncbi:MAG: DUF3108 domain-containing protein [Paludibacteraceae bacterium]
MRRLISVTAIAVLFSGAILAQIHPNEKFVYAGSYNMSGLMTPLAQITIQTSPIQTSKKTYIHLLVTASTYTKWDGFFKIRDLYESYVDPVTLKPSLYKRNVLEGSYKKTEKYTFSSNGTVNSTVSKHGRAPQNKSFRVGGATSDIVTVLFKLRKLDFSKFTPGQTVSFTIVFDEKEYPVSAKYMGKETVSNAGNLGTKECYKLSVAAKTNALRGKDKNLVWLTADANKVPVLIKFSIPVGTGQVKLTSASGL